MITASVMKELIFQILEGANSNENQRQMTLTLASELLKEFLEVGL